MKYLICTLFILFSLKLSAHTPVQKCITNGKVSFTWSDIGNATSIEISYSHYDTTISLKRSSVTTFAAPLGTKTKVTFKFNDGYSTSFVVIYDPCALPVDLEYFKKTVAGFEWKTDIEVNASHYNVQYNSGDTSAEWVTLARIEATGPQVYSYNFNSSTEAGMLTGLVFFFLVGLVYKYRKAFAIVILIGFLVSCSKTNVKPTMNKSRIGFYRLQEVDKDNNTQYSPVIEIK